MDGLFQGCKFGRHQRSKGRATVMPDGRWLDKAIYCAFTGERLGIAATEPQTDADEEYVILYSGSTVTCGYVEDVRVNSTPRLSTIAVDTPAPKRMGGYLRRSSQLQIA